MANAYSRRAFSMTFDPPPPCESELSVVRVRRPVRRACRQRSPADVPPHTRVMQVLLVSDGSERARRRFVKKFDVRGNVTVVVGRRYSSLGGGTVRDQWGNYQELVGEA